jgi:hypothetical protein
MQGDLLTKVVPFRTRDNFSTGASGVGLVERKATDSEKKKKEVVNADFEELMLWHAEANVERAVIFERFISRALTALGRKSN